MTIFSGAYCFMKLLKEHLYQSSGIGDETAMFCDLKDKDKLNFYIFYNRYKLNDVSA